MASDYLSLDDLGRVGHLDWALHKHSYPVGKRMVRIIGVLLSGKEGIVTGLANIQQISPTCVLSL